MSYNHQLTAAAQPETGSPGFGADSLENMLLVGDNFNSDSYNANSFNGGSFNVNDFKCGVSFNGNTFNDDSFNGNTFNNDGFNDNSFNVKIDGFEDDHLPNVDWNAFTTGDDHEEMPQAPDYAGAGQVHLSGLEPSANLQQDFFSQQTPTYLSGGVDAFLSVLSQDTLLPSVDHPNNHVLDESTQDSLSLVSAPASADPTAVQEDITADVEVTMEDEDADDDSNSLFSGSSSAAASLVQEHFTSDNEITVDNEDIHQNTSDLQVATSACTQEPQAYLTPDDAMPLKDQQLLYMFLSSADQQFLESPALLSAGAFQNDYHMGSDAETLVDQQHHNTINQDHIGSDEETLIDQSQHTANTSQNFQESVPKSSIALIQGADQLQAQANARAAAPAPMSAQQLEMFQRHLAIQVQNLSEKAKYDFLASIPPQVMDQLKLANPMPSTQLQAAAPQLPAQISQQNNSTYQQAAVSYPTQPQPARAQPQQSGAMFRQLSGPSRPQAPQQVGNTFEEASSPFQSHTPPASASPLQNSAKFLQSAGSSHSQPSPAHGSPAQSGEPAQQPARKPRARRPAPISAPPPFVVLSAEQCCEMVSPEPSPSSDAGLSSETYEPLISYVAPEIDSENPPLYPEYRGTFKTGGQARRFRKRIQIPPKLASDLVRVKKFGRQYWVHKLYDAMIDISDMIDGITSINRKRFELHAFWDPQDLEATAHAIFDEIIAVHERGWNRPEVYHKRVVRGKLVDKSQHSAEARLAAVCDLLRSSKAVVDDCMRGGITMALVVDNPQARQATKESNNAGNDKRGIRLAKAKALLEAEQGGPASDAQIASLLRKIIQEEQEEAAAAQAVAQAKSARKTKTKAKGRAKGKAARK